MNIQDSDWYKSRPKAVQERIDQYPPNHLYRMKDTGHIVFLQSYQQQRDGACDTCIVSVTYKYNPFLLMERNVFGIAFDDLEDLGDLDDWDGTTSEGR